jgi:DNA processing protein
MNNNLPKDSLAMILICSNLGMDINNASVKPFTVKQWSTLSSKLLNSEMKRPAAFFETGEQEWKKQLLLSDDEVIRLKTLLSRAGQVGIELEYLNSTGIYVTTRAEKNYPKRLKEILKKKSPPVIFYCGDINITQSDGVAIVGSRNIDEKALDFTDKLAKKCVSQGFTVISGGARGVDTAAQNAALSSGGKVVSVIADGLLQKIKQKAVRDEIMSGNLLLISPFNPRVNFTVYNAMDRNKYVYALSKYAVVVSSDYNKGGTWAGATENLKNKWVPLFVRGEDGVPNGNLSLIASGAVPLSTNELNKNYDISEFFEGKEKEIKESNYIPEQLSLFLYVKEKTEEMNNESKTVANENSETDLDRIDLFTVVWPYIKKVLKEAKSKDQLSELLDVNKVQLTTWLDRAIKEKKVKKLTRPVRYILDEE